MTKTPSKKLSRVTAAILTIAFLGFVFAAFFTMLIGSYPALRKSVQLTPEPERLSFTPLQMLICFLKRILFSPVFGYSFASAAMCAAASSGVISDTSIFTVFSFP